jgi:hypothetical protein
LFVCLFVCLLACRVLSLPNLHTLPLTEAILQSSVDQLVANATNNATPLNSRLVKALSLSTQDSHYKAQLDKVHALQYRHRIWEGSLFPQGQRDRPLGNFFHSKMIIAIDWEVLSLPSMELCRMVLGDNSSCSSSMDLDDGETTPVELKRSNPSVTTPSISIEREIDVDSVEGQFVFPLSWLAPSADTWQSGASRFATLRPATIYREDESYQEYDRRLNDKIREMRSLSVIATPSFPGKECCNLK